MQISYTALAGQTDFVSPGGTPSAVTVNGGAATITARPGGFTITSTAPTAGQLVVATFPDPVRYTTLAELTETVDDHETRITDLETP